MGRSEVVFVDVLPYHHGIQPWNGRQKLLDIDVILLSPDFELDSDLRRRDTRYRESDLVPVGIA